MGRTLDLNRSRPAFRALVPPRLHACLLVPHATPRHACGCGKPQHRSRDRGPACVRGGE